MPDRDELDFLIDAAVTSYADPGPNSGLERHVLARISMAAARRCRRLIWLAGLPALATAGVLLLISNTEHTQPHLRPEAGTVIERPLSALPGSLGTSSRAEVRSGFHRRKALQASDASALPKQDVFPSPAPLSNEEKALVRLVGRTPEAERPALAAMTHEAAEPIHIATISIPSINPPAEGKE